jgi:hypothetical protein
MLASVERCCSALYILGCYSTILILALPSYTSRFLIKVRNGKISTIILGLLLCCILLKIAAISKSSILSLPIGSITISRLILYTIASRAYFYLEDLYVSRLLEKRLSTF